MLARASAGGVALALALAILGAGATPVGAAATGVSAKAEDTHAANAPRVRRAADRLVAAGVPGVVVLVREGRRELRVTRGFADLARRNRMRVGMRFRVGSVTKTFVATRVLQLVGQRRLALDDTAERWLPGLVPNGGAITVRQLLNHTTGLADYEQDLLPLVAADPQKRWTTSELLSLALAKPSLFPPGTGWAYSNTGYLLLGLIIERATGESLASELRRGIFRPLGLKRTSYDMTPGIAGAHARGYRRIDGRRRDVTDWSPSYAGAAGAIVSTAGDLVRFERALLQGQLIDSSLLAAMRTTVSMGLPGERYGLGIWRSRSLALSPTFKLPCGRVWGHNGDIPGYFTNAFSSRDGRRQIVVLVNDDTLTRRAVTALAELVGTAYCGSASV